MNYAIFLAQTPGPEGCLSALALPVVMIVLMYLLLIRPQQKQMKQQQAFQDSLKVGDQVVTAGGIYGRVVSLAADTVTLEIATRAKVRFVRSQIMQTAASVDESSEQADDVKS